MKRSFVWIDSLSHLIKLAMPTIHCYDECICALTKNSFMLFNFTHFPFYPHDSRLTKPNHGCCTQIDFFNDRHEIGFFLGRKNESIFLVLGENESISYLWMDVHSKKNFHRMNWTHLCNQNNFFWKIFFSIKNYFFW